MTDREIVGVYWCGSSTAFGTGRGTLLAGGEARRTLAPEHLGESVEDVAKASVQAIRHRRAEVDRRQVRDLHAHGFRLCACGCRALLRYTPGEPGARYLEGHAKSPNRKRRRALWGALTAEALKGRCA